MLCLMSYCSFRKENPFNTVSTVQRYEIIRIFDFLTFTCNFYNILQLEY